MLRTRLGLCSLALVFAGLLGGAGCSDSAKDGAGGKGSGGNGSTESTTVLSSGVTHPNSTSGTAGTAGTSSTGSDTTSSTGTTMGPLGGSFAHGINTGYWPPFTDNDTSQLAALAGSDSVRVKMPEDFFNTWGYPILVDAMKNRATLGMSNHVAWFCTPTADHSTAPDKGNLEYFIPKNLYEPIFNGDGSVNPQNYWANYVFQTVTTYSPYVKVYSVWNEPDWVSDYSISQGWATKAPVASDLPRFNGSIYDYARMLRIAKEVSAKVDPTVKIASGGLGYPNFLLALTKYTDNPDGGKVTSDYPSVGVDYLDVLDLHYYPLYTPGNSDAGSDGLIAHRASFAKVLSDAGIADKPVVYTENGAPHVKVGSAPGGTDYAKNYYLKSMVKAQAEGFSGIHWFILSDGADTSSDSYQSMGLYSNLTSAGTIDKATKTETGVAATTLGMLTKGYLYDDDTTKTVKPPSGVEAYVLKGSKRILVAWATTSDGNEDASGKVTLPFAAKEMHWDFATTSTTVDHASGDSVDVASDPRFFAEE